MYLTVSFGAEIGGVQGRRALIVWNAAPLTEDGVVLRLEALPVAQYCTVD